MHVSGLRQQGERFAQLGAAVQKKVARAAVRAAAVLVRDAARADHPWTSRSGLLEKSIACWRVSRASYPGMEVWTVGVPGTRKAYVNNVRNRRKGRASWTSHQTYNVDGSAYYWKFIEYGTVKMGPLPFLNPALAQNVGRATDKTVSTLKDGIDKAVRALPPQTPSSTGA